SFWRMKFASLRCGAPLDPSSRLSKAPPGLMRSPPGPLANDRRNQQSQTCIVPANAVRHEASVFAAAARETRPMARKLKTYLTSLGFYEQAIASPSMKAALEAWGADSNLFHQGAAKESTDPDIVDATMKKPGVVLKRPVGSGGPFGEHAELPKNLGHDGRKKPAHKPSAKAKKSSAPPDKAADRKA